MMDDQLTDHRRGYRGICVGCRGRAMVMPRPIPEVIQSLVVFPLEGKDVVLGRGLEAGLEFLDMGMGIHGVLLL